MSKLCTPNTEKAGWYWVYIPSIKGMGYGKAVPLWWNSFGWEHPLVYIILNGESSSEEFGELADSLDPETATKFGWEYRGPCEGLK